MDRNGTDDLDETELPEPSPDQMGPPEPSFLRGTLVWMGRGYSYASAPPFDLSRAEALSSADPWLALAARIHHAKRGDFRPIREFLNILSLNDSAGVVQGAIKLAGDAACRADLPELVRFMQTDWPPYIRVTACEAATMSGVLDLVPSVLQTWRDTPSERNAIASFLSALLEEHDGSISEGPAWDFDDDSPEADARAIDAYVDLVMSRAAELEAQYGSAPTFFRGAPKSLRKLVEIMRAEMAPRSDYVDLGATFIPLRHHFEAITGVDCTGFYEDADFRPLAASAIIEDFLERTDVARYAPGARYFFNHAVP